MAKPEQMLFDKGFEVGVHVSRTKASCKDMDDKSNDKNSGQIKAITSQHVILKLRNGADAVINSGEFMTGKWVKFNPKAENKEITWWHDHAAYPDIKAMLTKARLAIAVDKLVKQKAKNWAASCAVFSKPRMVKAKRNLTPEELQLVPSSPTIGSNPIGAWTKLKTVSRAAVALEVDNLIVHMMPYRLEPKQKDSKTQQPTNKESAPKQGETKQEEPQAGAALQGETKQEEPEFTPGFMVPFWEVQSTTKPSEANMEFKMMSTVQDGIAVPVMVNSKAVKAGAELKYLETDFPRVPKSLLQDPQAAEKKDEKEKNDQAAGKKDNDQKEPAVKKQKIRS